MKTLDWPGRRREWVRGPRASARRGGLVMAVVCAGMLSGCATKPPQISYDNDVPALPAPPVALEEKPRALHVPPAWKVSFGGRAYAKE